MLKDKHRCYHNGKLLVLSQWVCLVFSHKDGSKIIVVSRYKFGAIARIKVWIRMIATELFNWRMTRLTWQMEVVLNLSCKGICRLILNLLKEEFLPGFPLEWVFSLVACLHLVSSSICCLAFVLMIRKRSLERINNNNENITG